jgi:hypothetical protein
MLVQVRIIVRSVAVVLICALPGSALAQIREGVMLPAHSDRSVPTQAPGRTNDPDKDSIKEGAIIGAIVLGTWCLIICGQGLDSSGQLPLAVAASAGMGALLGAGIDSGFSRGPRVLFRWRF